MEESFITALRDNAARIPVLDEKPKLCLNRSNNAVEFLGRNYANPDQQLQWSAEPGK